MIGLLEWGMVEKNFQFFSYAPPSFCWLFPSTREILIASFLSLLGTLHSRKNWKDMVMVWIGVLLSFDFLMLSNIWFLLRETGPLG